MPQPSVTKAFADSPGAALIQAGFLRDGTKRFRRVSGDICQCVFLHAESRTRREFLIEYCTFLTVVPHGHYPLDHGGRLPVGSRGKWYRADTDEQLARSITTVGEHMPSLIAWFIETSTIEGYIRTYLSLRKTQPPPLSQNGHSTLNLACAYLLAGNQPEASRLAAIAEEEFENILTRIPETQVWSVLGRDRCRELSGRILDSTYPVLFDNWRQETYAALKMSN